MALLENFQLNKKSLTKLLSLVVIFIFIIIAIYFVANYFTTGGVEINTKKDAEIYAVTIVKGKYDNKLLGKTTYRARYSPGTYTFMVSSGESSTIKSVEVKTGQSQKISIELVESKKPTKVVSAQAIDIQALTNEINYVNSSYNYLETYKLGSKAPSNYPIAESTSNITAAQWVGNKKALIRIYTTSTGYLDGNKFQIFNPLPISKGEDTELSNILNQIIMNNKLEIISQINSSIYYQKNINSAPETIVNNINSSGLNLDLANNSLYAYSKTYDISEDNQSTKNKESSSDRNIFIGKLSDKNFSEKIESKSDISIIKFSPDGNKLIYSNADGLYVYSFDKKQSVLLYAKQPEKVTISKWLDNQNIIFIDNGKLWKMDTISLTANNISTPENINFVSSISVSEDKQKVYYTVQLPNARGSGNTVYSIDL